MKARTQLLRAEGLKKSYGERAAVIDTPCKPCDCRTF